MKDKEIIASLHQQNCELLHKLAIRNAEVKQAINELKDKYPEWSVAGGRELTYREVRENIIELLQRLGLDAKDSKNEQGGETNDKSK